MSTQILKKVRKKENERLELLSQLFESKEMVNGSFCQIYVKCGKKNCKCFSGKGHPHKRMSLSENGKKFSRAVPAEDYEWIEEMTNNFRSYKLIRRKLAKIDLEIKVLLDRFEENCIKQTRKGKSYLNVLKTNSEGNCKKGSEKKQ